MSSSVDMTCFTYPRKRKVIKSVILYFGLVVYCSFSDSHPEYKNDSFVHDNMAVLHIYFEKLHFIMHERGELFTTIEIISNIGGLLGLCLGLSVLSIAEFIYFFTARLYYNIVTPRSEDF